MIDGGRPARPRPTRTRLPGHREVVKEDHRGIGEAQRGPHLLLLARDATGWRSLCRLVSRANLVRDEGRPEVHPGAAGGARGGADRAVRLPRGRAGATAAGRRPGGSPGGGGAIRDAVRAGDGGPARRVGRGKRLRARAVPPPPARRRLARRGDGAPGRGAGAAGGRDQRRPLRPARGPRAPRRADRDPPRPIAARAAGPPATGRGVVPQGRGRPACAAAGGAVDRRRGPGARAGLAGGDRGVGGDRRGVPGGAHLRALPLPGLRRAAGRDPVQPPDRRCAGRARNGAITR